MSNHEQGAFDLILLSCSSKNEANLTPHSTFKTEDVSRYLQVQVGVQRGIVTKIDPRQP